MSILSKVRIGNTDAPWRVCVYGPAGAGKSSFAAACPRALVLPVEEGVNQIQVAQLPKAKSWAEVHEVVDVLIAEDHNYMALVIDGIDAAEALVVTAVEQESRKSFRDLNDDFGAGYQLVTDAWRKMLAKLDLLRGTKGMRVLLVGHSKISSTKNIEGKDFDRHEIAALSKSTAAVIRDWSDYVLFLRREISVSQADSKGKKQMAYTGDRYLNCHGTAQFEAKTRGDCAFPEKILVPNGKVQAGWEAFETTADMILRHGRLLPEVLETRLTTALPSIDEPKRGDALTKFAEAKRERNYIAMRKIADYAEEVVRQKKIEKTEAEKPAN
jgi:hypothetical protein